MDVFRFILLFGVFWLVVTVHIFVLLLGLLLELFIFHLCLNKNHNVTLELSISAPRNELECCLVSQISHHAVGALSEGSAKQIVFLLVERVRFIKA